MLSNDSTESIVEESLASTTDSFGSRMVKSQSVFHSLGKDKVAPVEATVGSKSSLAKTRDIFSVPNLVDIKDELPVNDVQVITGGLFDS